MNTKRGPSSIEVEGDIEVDSTEPERSSALAKGARDALYAEGMSDAEIVELAERYAKLEENLDVESFLTWVRHQEL
jgi:hypothetical protein